jgi:hypothetical protein
MASRNIPNIAMKTGVAEVLRWLYPTAGGDRVQGSRPHLIDGFSIRVAAYRGHADAIDFVLDNPDAVEHGVDVAFQAINGAMEGARINVLNRLDSRGVALPNNSCPYAGQKGLVYLLRYVRSKGYDRGLGW